MDALILSCGTGGGHNAAAAALKAELERCGHHVSFFNPYDLYSRELSEHINQTYIQLAKKAPTLFGLIYGLGEMYRRLPWRSPVYLLNKKMAPYLQKYLEEHHTDVILMTHIFPAQILTCLRERGVALPKTLLVATDYTCIPFAEECSCDAYVIPSAELAGEFIRRGIPEEKLHPLGIPVGSAFASSITREQAQQQLGLDPRKHYILVASGSLGVNKMRRVIRRLYKLIRHTPSMRLAVVCGGNRAMYDSLKKSFGDSIDVIGMTDQMPLYLRSSEVYLTKAGGLSTTEAAVNGTLLGLLPTIPGCESHNVRFFKQHGMCRTVHATRRSLRRLLSLLGDEETLASMEEQQRSCIRPDAAQTICSLADEMSGQEDEDCLTCSCT